MKTLNALALTALVIATVVLTPVACADCATQVVNGVAWRYSLVGDGAQIGGYNLGDDRRAVSQDVRGALTVPSKLGGYPVTQVGQEAFRDCTGITSVTVPEGVTYIDYRAFYGCTALASISLPASLDSISNDVFENCPALMMISVKSGNVHYASKGGILYDKALETLIRCPARLSFVTIPATVTTISSEAFAGCDDLTSIDIPAKVTYIGNDAFSGCTNLRRVTGGLGLQNVSRDAFADTPFVTEAAAGPVRLGNVWVAYSGNVPSKLVIPEGIISISFGFSGINDITLPSTLTCSYLPDFSGSVIRVISVEDWFRHGYMTGERCCGMEYDGPGYDLYCGGKRVTDLTISGTITNVPSRIFYKCTSLASVEIEAGVLSVPATAFEGCSALRSIDVSAGNPRYASADGVLYDKNRTTLICCPPGKATVVMTSGVTQIATGAFCGCGLLSELDIPSAVRSIGENAFKGCTNLLSVTGGGALTSVAQGAFADTPFQMSVEEGPVRIGSAWVAYAGDLPETLVIPEGIRTVSFSFSSVDELTVPSTYQSDVLSFGGTVLRVPSLDWWFAYGGVTIDHGWCGCCGMGQAQPETGRYYLFIGSEMAQDVIIPANLGKVPARLFAGCLSLLSVTIEEGVTEIDADAFYLCSNLTEANLPQTLRTIGNAAFGSCAQLDLTLPKTLDSISGSAFDGTLAFENAVASAKGGAVYLGNWCFGVADNEDCPASVTIKTGTRGIVASAFCECAGLTSVTLPKGLLYIGSEAFADTSLKSVKLPDGLISLGCAAFAGSSLTSVPKLPSSLQSCGGKLYSCSSDGWSVTPWYAQQPKGWIVQDGWLIDYKAYDCYYDSEDGHWTYDDCEDGDWPERLVVPSGVKHIAFLDDNNGDYAGDAVLEVVLPEGLVTIGSHAFAEAELNEVTIPASVIFIGADAFEWADGPITFLGAPPGIGGDDDGDGPFSEASIGYFVAGTDGWTNGMTFAGLTMIARGDPAPVTPQGVSFDSVEDVACEAGEAISVSISCTSESAVTYKATGLPKGVKFDTKKGLVSGTPTVPGKYTVSITATNKKKETATLTFQIIVANYTSDYFSVDDELHFTPGAAIDPIDLSACGLDFDAGDTLAVKGLPKGLSYGAKTFLITGTPTVPGDVTVTFTAKVKTTDEKGKSKTVSSVATATWTVDPLPVLAVTALDADGSEASSAIGTVTGGGSYLPGKKVTLKATVKSGYVFAGWFGLDDTRYTGDNRSPSLAYVTADADEEVFAYFVSKEEDAESLDVSLVTPVKRGDELSYDDWTGELYVGVQTTQQVSVASLSLPTVKVTGLPTGLRFNAKTCQIYGIPSKAGDYTIKIKATNASGASVSETFALTVVALPTWATGTFAGTVSMALHRNDNNYQESGNCVEGNHEYIDGAMTLTVAKAGKISGKIQAKGKTYSFTCAGFARKLDGEAWGGGTSWQWTRFVSVLSIKVGKITVSLPVYLEENGASEGEGLGYGQCGIYDEGVFHPTTTAPAYFCWWDMSLAQTLSSRRDVAVLPTATYTRCLTGDAYPEQLGESGWLTIRTATSGKVTIVGRMFGNAVSMSAECAIGEIADGFLTRADVPFSVPANARTGSLGYTGSLYLYFGETGLGISFDQR